MKPLPVLLVGLLLAFPVFAQQSTSYKITDRSFNAGGHPDGGTVLTSTSYRVTLDSIGDAVVARGLDSASYNVDGGFTAGYPPPGEVLGLRFTGGTTLAWDPERSVGDYSLHRGVMSLVAGYGACEQWDIADETTTDTDPVPAGDGFFYLVAAQNRLGEEGTLGQDGSGGERMGSGPCP